MSRDLLSEDEMRGYLSNLPKWVSSKQRVQAVVEHFFTHILYREFPSEYGLKFAKNLLEFMDEARKEAKP